MSTIVDKLHENRQIQLAKEILESNGYKVEKKSVVPAEGARDEILNTWSYGWKGTPWNQSDDRDVDDDVFEKYQIRDEDSIYDLSDEDAIAMYNELKSIHNSKRFK